MPCVVLVKCRAKLYEAVDLGRPSVGWVAVIPPEFDFCDCSDVFSWKQDSPMRRTQEWLLCPSSDLEMTLGKFLPLSGPQFFHW